jgi:hypothetical protein
MTAAVKPIDEERADRRRQWETLRAAGWRCVGEAGGGSWSRRDCPRVDTHPTQTKLRWEVAT